LFDKLKTGIELTIPPDQSADKADSLDKEG